MGSAVKRGRSEEGEVKILGIWVISLVGLWTRNWNRG